ncbi:hypothetical protein ACFOOM_09985 [Streptomyces echinoruber]|uniref:Uncharacterized protein n=1 Tax=Streptomyces echinoruber TaxID=68898 RepID=A0A918VSZ8_9ACTN|nr:hypothetical protein [Streptomyces echinoruber]GHA20040.1 hypothetical protein GCM10010389_66630 [Streptomyces echinoruber]
MTRVPDRIAVASLDTHRLIIAVRNDGTTDVSSNLHPHQAAGVLRQLADSLDHTATREAQQAPADWVADVRDALDFNAEDRDPALATLRDVLLDDAPRTPAQALAAARILLGAHARHLAALVDHEQDATRGRWGLNRSTRGLLTGFSNARRTLTAYADRLADEQALADADDREGADR